MSLSKQQSDTGHDKESLMAWRKQKRVSDCIQPVVYWQLLSLLATVRHLADVTQQKLSSLLVTPAYSGDVMQLAWRSCGKLHFCCHCCRMTDRDMVIAGYRVPKGTPISLPPYCLHTDAANFDQPLRFWPQRWEQPVASVAKPLTTGKGRHCFITVMLQS